MKNIAVIGLGLIGGSLAAALKGFEDYNIIGVDNDRDTRLYAEEYKIGDIITDDTKYAVEHSEIVICCLHPRSAVQFLQDHRDDFVQNALVTDVCGVKTAIMDASECLRDDVDFIGMHPMAGKERGGIVNSTEHLFKGSHFIVTPKDSNKPENVAMIKKIANYLGCLDVTETTPEKHDQIIAYTSQVMHVLAVSVVDDPSLFDCIGFEGGSFRDCTRVAALEPEIWTELFTMNIPALTQSIRNLENNLKMYREIIESGDSTTLMKKLKSSSDRKRSINIEHRRGDDIVLSEED